MHKSVKIAFFWIITLFIGLFIATYVTIQYANRDPIQVIESNYYEKGLNYEKVISEQKKMIAEGYSFRGDIFNENYILHKGQNKVSISFEKKGKQVPDSKITLRVERGATDRYNSVYRMKAAPGGEYTAEINIVYEGPWFVTVTAETDGKSMVKTNRIYAE